MTYTTIEQIEAAETSALIIFYNSKVEKQIKKFADRQSAVKRCIALLPIEDQGADEAPESGNLESEQDTTDEKPNFIWPFAPVGKLDGSKKSAPKTMEADDPDEDDWMDGEKPKKAKPATKAKPTSDKSLIKGEKKKLPAIRGLSTNAEGIAASWNDPDVAAARLTRNGVTVTVDGQTNEFKSVREAFRHYRLPDNKHIRFRGILKAEKTSTFTLNGKSYLFAIVD